MAKNKNFNLKDNKTKSVDSAIFPEKKVNLSREPTTGSDNIGQEETKEQLYLDAKDLYLPFSNNVRADQYLKLKRCEYWNRQSIREILEEILDDYLDKNPAANKALPDKEVAKLKALKSANDYMKQRLK